MTNDINNEQQRILAAHPVLQGHIGRHCRFIAADNPVTRHIGLARPNAPTEADVHEIYATGRGLGNTPYLCVAVFFHPSEDGAVTPDCAHIDYECSCNDAEDIFVGWLVTFRPQSAVFDDVPEVFDPIGALFRAAAPLTAEQMKASTYRATLGHPWVRVPTVEGFKEATEGRPMTVCDAADLLDMLEEARSAVGRDIVHGDVNGDSPKDVTDNVLATIEYGVIRRWLAQFYPDRFEGGHHPDEGEGYADDDEMQEAYADCGFERDR